MAIADLDGVDDEVPHLLLLHPPHAETNHRHFEPVVERDRHVREHAQSLALLVCDIS